MKAHHCTRCGRRVFFENVTCNSCGAALGFVPGEGMVSFEPGERGWARLGGNGAPQRPCANYVGRGVCNWMVGADDVDPLCRSCRLTRVIPALDAPGNIERWATIEQAKRRLVYALIERGLPLRSKSEDETGGLAFELLEQTPSTPRVMTGHDSGVITLNIAEADDAARERMRNAMHEPYRTLLGHFRHESGHYYWDRLVDGSALLDGFRARFGDERTDYASALASHYETPSTEWQADFVSAYASAHPWEDWAETWAHYWHIADGLETAQAWGLQLSGVSRDSPAVSPTALPEAEDIASNVVEQWLPVSQFVNAMDRSLGTRDSYPFVLGTPVVEKLRFVHRVVLSALSRPASGLAGTRIASG
jgi:hypothetical protein